MRHSDNIQEFILASTQEHRNNNVAPTKTDPFSVSIAELLERIRDLSLRVDDLTDVIKELHPHDVKAKRGVLFVVREQVQPRARYTPRGQQQPVPPKRESKKPEAMGLVQD